MRRNRKRSPKAQKRIDYIVFGNPRRARKLLRSYDIRPPKKLDDVLTAVKKLVREKGRKVIKDLIRIHPDRRAIIRIAKQDGEVSYNAISKEDSYCSSCNEYSFNPNIGICSSCAQPAKRYTLEQLKELPLDQLQTHYKTVLARANALPKDKGLALEVQQVWNVLRQKIEASVKKETPKDNAVNSGVITTKQLVILALTLASGILIGSSLK